MAVINELIEKMGNDKDFAEKITSASSTEEFEKLVKEAGFDVTAEDLKKTVPTSTGELSDEELENVAGGYTYKDFYDMTKEEILELLTIDRRQQLSRQELIDLEYVVCVRFFS